MSNEKRSHSETRKIQQRQKTAKNQIEKYERLLKTHPNNVDAEKWQSSIEFYLQFV